MPACFQIVIFVVLAPFLVLKAHAEKDVDLLLHRFCELKNAGSASCDYPSREESSLVESTGPSWSEFFAKQSCGSLLDPAPPEWLNRNPNAGVFKDPGNWQPVCSNYRLELIRTRHREYNDDQVVAAVNAFMHESDTCEAPKKNRYSSAYRNPSQAERKVKVMDEAQRNATLQDFKAVQASVTRTCCGDDELCAQTMKKVEVRMCQPETDPTKSDRCIARGVYYMAEFDPKWVSYIQKGLTPARWKLLLGAYELKPGHVSLSPFAGENSKNTYAHELGHACSRIRKKLAIYRGSSEELAEYKSLSSCEINENNRVTYARLLKSQDLNQMTTDCFYNRASDAKKTRFKEGTCDRGCSSSALEEAYAETFRLLTLPEKQWVPEILPKDFCSYVRDGRHMLTGDVLSCMLKSPSFVKRVERATSCRK